MLFMGVSSGGHFRCRVHGGLVPACGMRFLSEGKIKRLPAKSKYSYRIRRNALWAFHGQDRKAKSRGIWKDGMRLFPGLAGPGIPPRTPSGFGAPKRASILSGKQPLFNGLLRSRWPIGNSSRNEQAVLQIPQFVNCFFLIDTYTTHNS